MLGKFLSALLLKQKKLPFVKNPIAPIPVEVLVDETVCVRGYLIIKFLDAAEFGLLFHEPILMKN